MNRPQILVELPTPYWENYTVNTKLLSDIDNWCMSELGNYYEGVCWSRRKNGVNGGFTLWCDNESELLSFILQWSDKVTITRLDRQDPSNY